jgi:hypothetical protein
MANCQICETRRPRRFCPGVRGEICAPCCGSEREQTVDCPLDCEYLREARLHEKPREVTEADFPNRDVSVTEQFLLDHEPLLIFLAQAVLAGAVESQGSIDQDVRDALAALIKTYRTLESGLIYETRPTNPYAAAIQARVQSSIAEMKERLTQATGMVTLRDVEILGVLVFLEQIAIQRDNGRRRGRAFIDFLFTNFQPAPSEAGAR